MFRVLSVRWAVVALSSFVASTSFAASVFPVNGDVQINRGSGFQAITTQVVANPGDTVMVSPNGDAKIVYDNQCSVKVGPGSVVAVSATAPCGKQEAASAPLEGRMSLGGCPDKSFCAPPESVWDPVHQALVPITTIGVLVGLCVGDVICDKSASP